MRERKPSTGPGLFDELIDRHRGRIAKTAGDSVVAEFASVLHAVHCAIEIQKTIANANEFSRKRDRHRHQCR
jgi:adenylate cyclase